MNIVRKNTQIVLLAVIEWHNKILFTLRNDPESSFHRAWQLPGGGLEFGEAPHEALEREVREELGIKLKSYEFIPYIHTETRGSWQGVFLSFLCSPEPNQQIVLNEEATEYVWQPRSEIAKLNPMPGCIEVIKSANRLQPKEVTLFLNQQEI